MISHVAIDRGKVQLAFAAYKPFRSKVRPDTMHFLRMFVSEFSFNRKVCHGFIVVLRRISAASRQVRAIANSSLRRHSVFDRLA